MKEGEQMDFSSQYMNNTDYKSGEYTYNSIMPMALANITNHYGTITLGYNNQFNMLYNTLNARRAELNQIVQNNLLNNPSYTGSRNAGVKLAWQYEKADIEMGGKGSAKWNFEERDQILNSKTGTVAGAEGHHQKNVVDHPEEQANPDNIKFFKSKQEHLQKGHNGNFQNESDGDFIDKNKMLKHTNNKRVLLNEIKGATISAAIGIGVAMTISAIVELASVGIESADVSNIITHSMRAGIEAGAMASLSYCAGRITSTILQKSGIDILSKAGMLINYTAIGVVSIGLVSVIQFIKLSKNGMEAIDAFKEVGKSALASTAILAVSIIAQGIYGGCAGLIVSTSVGIVILTFNITKLAHQRKINTRIEEYVIEEHKPILITG